MIKAIDRRIPVTVLKQACRDIFTAAKVPAADAAILGDVLVTTDMRGIHSHGVIRCARYIECLQSGGIKAAAEPVVLSETPTALRVSAAGGLGIPAAEKTVRRVIHKAKQVPVVIGTVNHSDHYGAAGYYAMSCAEAGLIGFSMSNTCPLIAPTGGSRAAIGNNPFAYAAPGKAYRGVLFDICMSMAASGKLIIAAANGEKIPKDWIMDRDGLPTDDPAEIYRDAVMMPFAAHKGYGFAVMVELLSGILAGAAITEDVHSWNMVPGADSGTGHCFIAVNPEFFGGLDYFRGRVDLLIGRLTSTRTAPGVERVYYPGEIEFERERGALEDGVLLPKASLDELRRAAALVHIDADILSYEMATGI